MITEEVADWDEEDVKSDVSETNRDSGNLSSLDCWDYTVELECLKGPEDLQLAAELGKTLLERNKELEINLRQCQNIIDEQTQEIEYLTKQSTALRKTNDNRIRIYEQLEVSIQDLERANQRLALDNSTDKKTIKSLCAYRSILETRCEELQKALDEARVQQTIQKEKLRRLSNAKEKRESSGEEETKTSCASITSQTSTEQTPADEDLINQLSIQNQELKSQMSRDQRKIADLEEAICRSTQDLALLSEELYQREEQVKSLREKMSDMEEVRSELLCVRCLKEVALKMPQEMQMVYDLEEDSLSDGGKYCGTVHRETKDENSYKTLTEKYESLMKEQAENEKNCLSLQDELKLFAFDSLRKVPEEDEETQNKDEVREEQRNANKNKMFMNTAADFSEAETSSSGFSDETSNKSTQTELGLYPGSFLCAIADGEDCKFSIYDNACPIESRFRKTPEYRTLFREIFAVLKKAAEAKSNGETLPLLDDLTPNNEVPEVPPVTPAQEEPPIDLEDVESVPESCDMSEAASETSSTVERLEETLKETTQEEDTQNQPSPGPSTPKDARLTNDILEYISIGIGVKKKSKRRYVNSPARKAKAPEIAAEKLENSPRKAGGRRRKEWRNYDSPITGSRTQSPATQPHVLTTLERRETPPNAHNKTTNYWSFQPLVSTAAQEVAKLKKLEKSYAEVLRHRPPPKNFGRADFRFH